MTKTQHIDFWKQSALRDWDSVQVLYKGKQYMQTLFFCHLVVEKLIKAIWVKDNDENTPPFTHNLEQLYNQTELNINNSLVDLLPMINTWNIEGRYQDYKDKFYKRCTPEYTKEKLEQVVNLKECLIEKLQETI